MAVVALLAIFAALAGVSLRGPLSRARLESFLDRIETLDSRIRDEAERRRWPDELRIDVDRGKVYQGGVGRSPASSRSISFGDAVTIDRVRVGNRVGLHGELRVPITMHGQSDSYAVCLRSASGRKVWLVVLGATGQCVRTEEEIDVASLLAPLSL